MNKKVPLWLMLLLLWISLTITLLFGWAVYRIKSCGILINDKISGTIISVASFPTQVHKSFIALFYSNLVRPDIYPNINGLKVSKNYIDSNYLLLSTYDVKYKHPIVKLIRIYDQKIIHEWAPNIDELKKIFIKKDEAWVHADKHSFLLTHPLLSADGSIVFHDAVPSPLIKIDKDSKVIWTANETFGHSLEFDADGDIWAQSVSMDSKWLLPRPFELKDNFILKISPNGKLLFKKSVAQLLIENGFRGLLLGTGPYENDLLHINDIQPALTSTKYWIKGDLLISIKNKSSIFLYRPSTNKVIWLKTGPWLNQHDVDFIDSTRISIFGNDVVRNDYDERLAEGHNEEYIFDFKTNQTETPYIEFLKKANVSTITEGRSDILPNGDLFIEETNNNRLLRGNTKDIVWQYEERINNHSVAAVSWSRFITKEEFKKLTFLKNN